MDRIKSKCIELAICLDALRIIPRGLIIAGYVAYGVVVWWVASWFMAYPWNTVENQAVALALAGFPAVILSALGGVLGAITKAYFNSGGARE